MVKTIEIVDLENYCLKKKGAYQDLPFGEIPICYKLNGKIFAQIYPKKSDYKITLKCSADEGDFFRQAFPGIVVRGYHCPPVQQPYWNTVYIKRISDEVLLEMIDTAYIRVFESFSKKIQKEFINRFGMQDKK